MKTSLQEIWDEMFLKSDKGDLHSYLPVYEEIFAPYRETAKNILEIGIFKGASLLMWEQYFSGKVHGIDCSETPHGGLADLRPLINEGTHNIHIIDATNEFDIHTEFRGIMFQIIIDDGSHNILSQLRSYELLSKHLSDDGIYIIEDIENIDETRELFEKMDSSKKIEILDRRATSGRFDDILIIISKL